MSSLGEYAESIRLEIRFADRTEVYELKPSEFVKIRSQIEVNREPVEVDTGLPFRTFEPSPVIQLKLEATGGVLNVTRFADEPALEE